MSGDPPLTACRSDLQSVQITALYVKHDASQSKAMWRADFSSSNEQVYRFPCLDRVFVTVGFLAGPLVMTAAAPPYSTPPAHDPSVYIIVVPSCLSMVRIAFSLDVETVVCSKHRGSLW